MKNRSIVYCKAESDVQLQQILTLQKINLATSIDDDTFKSQGFVTAIHDLKLLKQMNSDQAHIIAMDGDQVVGYALSMTVNFSNRLPVLTPMFEMIKNLKYQGTLLNQKNYFIMGQVCVAIAYRSSGVFHGLYQHMKQCYSQHYDYVITEIDQRNTRSTAAHKKVGFKILHQYSANSDSQHLGIDWDLVIWDWT